jgi:hypothetical protein
MPGKSDAAEIGKTFGEWAAKGFPVTPQSPAGLEQAKLIAMGATEEEAKVALLRNVIAGFEKSGTFSRQPEFETALREYFNNLIMALPTPESLNLFDADEIRQARRDATNARIESGTFGQPYRPSGVYISAEQRTTLDEFQNYQDEYTEITKQGTKDRASIDKDYAKDTASLWKDLQKSLASLETDNAKSLASLNSDYQKSAAQAESNFQTQMARFEEDYATSRARAAQDHADRMFDLVASRDAAAMLQEMRDYKKSRERDESDHLTERGRRLADYAQQRAERWKDYQDRITELKANLEERRIELQRDYEERAAERATQYAEDLQAQKDAEKEQLDELTLQYAPEIAAALGLVYAGAKETTDEYYEQALKDAEKFVADANALWEKLNPAISFSTTDLATAQLATLSSTITFSYTDLANAQASFNAPHYAEGGYLTDSIYRAGENGKEFILNNRTTRAMESMFGPLSQDKFFRMSQAGVGGGGISVVVDQQNWTFSGSMSDEGRVRIQEMVRSGAYEAVADVLEHAM